MGACLVESQTVFFHKDECVLILPLNISCVFLIFLSHSDKSKINFLHGF